MNYSPLFFTNLFFSDLFLHMPVAAAASITQDTGNFSHDNTRVRILSSQLIFSSLYILQKLVYHVTYRRCIMTMDKFNKFLRNRQSLLIQYKMGDLTKNEFIEENYRYMESLGIKPFNRVDNIKKAIYNYHYYNVSAKYWQWLARDPKNSEKERQACLAESMNYYYLKDSATMSLLRLINFKAEAYYVRVKSSKLKDKLIEIVIKDPDILLEINAFYPVSGVSDNDYLILHTKSAFIANALKANGILKDDKRKSLTDNYINQKY